MKNNILFLILSILLTINTMFAQTPPTTLWSDNASTQWYNGQSLTYILTSPSDFAGLSVLVASGITFEDRTIIIGGSFDLGAHLWTPIGIDDNYPFKGTVNGIGNTLHNLFIVSPGDGDVGLLGKCIGVTMINLKIDGVYIRASDNVGSLVGSFSVKSKMENCHVENVDIVATQYNIGGLVGELVDSSHIKRCSSRGSVTGNNHVGGLLGTQYNLTTVSECYSKGTVIAEYLAGGLIGFSTSVITPNRQNTINNCYSRANISVAIGRAGGLCGGTDADLIIKNSYSTGTATGTEYDGGLIGAVGTVTTSNTYWDEQSSGHSSAIGGWTALPQTVDIIGKTTTEMKTLVMAALLNQNQATTPWSIYGTANDGYPILNSLPVSVTSYDEVKVQVAVYPTLFKSYIMIDSEEELSNYSIYDISGKMVQHGNLIGNEVNLNTASIKSGTYILIVGTAIGSVSKKIVKD